MAQDTVRSRTEMRVLMTAGRRKSSTMPARYTGRQPSDRGVVARYYRPGAREAHAVQPLPNSAQEFPATAS